MTAKSPSKRDVLYGLRLQGLRHSVERRAQLLGEFLQRIRLGEKLDVRIELPVVHDSVSGVAGGEEDGHSGAQGSGFDGHHSPVHALRENDIGEQDVDSLPSLSCASASAPLRAVRTA